MLGFTSITDIEAIKPKALISHICTHSIYRLISLRAKLDPANYHTMGKLPCFDNLFLAGARRNLSIK